MEFCNARPSKIQKGYVYELASKSLWTDTELEEKLNTLCAMNYNVKDV